MCGVDRSKRRAGPSCGVDQTRPHGLRSRLGPHSVNVLRWAASLASEFKSRLTLLHVVPRLDSPGEGYYADEWRRRLPADAGEVIAKVQQSPGIHVEAVVESGDVSKAVRTAAGRLNADLPLPCVWEPVAPGGNIAPKPFQFLPE